MENYKNPPITEALLEIIFELASDVTIKHLDDFASTLTEFPKKKPRRRFEGRFEIKEAEAISQAVDLGVDGFLCWAEDEKEVVQIRMDGFAFSRLKPYTGWENVFDKNMRLWEKFIAKFPPVIIKKISVRFINNIEIPERLFSLDDYFLVRPQIPAIDGAQIETFLTQNVFKIPSKDCRAILVQTMGQQASSPSVTPIVIDLDVSSDINTQLNTAELTKVFDKLRAVKNEIFEKIITSKTQGLFNE